MARPIGTEGHRPVSTEPIERLAPRELDVLRLMAQGETNAAIAAALGVRKATAQEYATRIYGKLGIFGNGAGNRAVASAMLARYEAGVRE